MGAFLLLAAAANAYRAATQGIVYDEATTYLMFLAGPLERVFTWYTANNHVLYSLLANATTELLGVTEFTLRLPAVVAGIGYLVVASLLAWRVCSTRLTFFLTVCALTLNPLVFDFLSAARGYGLALFLFTLALLELSREPERQRWTLASLALGGSVCANLAFAFPALALGIAASAIALKRSWPPKPDRELMTRFWLPGTLVTAAFLSVPLYHATLDTFFFGADTLLETAASVVSLSVRHHPTWWTNTWAAAAVERIIFFAGVATAVVVSSIAVVAALRRQQPSTMPWRTRWLVLCGGCFLVTIALLVAAHSLAGIRYPKARTGLYLIPLSVLALAGVAEWTRFRMVRWPANAVLFALALTSIEQFTVHSYGQWPYDAGSRRIAEIISSRAARHGRRVRVAATQYRFQPALEFYRVTRFADSLTPVADGFESGRAADFDLLVVEPDDAMRVSAACSKLYVDAVSGAQVWECSRAPLDTVSSPRTATPVDGALSDDRS